MTPDHDLQRYRRWYARLLRLYPERHRDRFGQSMAQTFNDLLRARRKSGRGYLGLALEVGFETLWWVIKANLSELMHSRHVRRPAMVTAWVMSIPFVMTIVDHAKVPGDGWHWGPFDFVAMGALLFGAGMTYEVLASRFRQSAHRAVVGTSITVAVFAIWIELAVDGVSKLLQAMIG